MNESRVREDAETEQPHGLLIRKWGDDKTGMRMYAPSDGPLELWRVHGGIPRKLAWLVTDDGDRWEWTKLGWESSFHWRDMWESRSWPVVAEHRKISR